MAILRLMVLVDIYRVASPFIRLAGGDELNGVCARLFFFFFESIYIPECMPKAKTGRRLATVCGGVRR